MTAPAARPALSLRRVVAVAQLRLRRVARTRLLLVALVLALLPWAIVDTPALVARISALATFTVVGLTALAAGAIADDLDSGEYAVVVTHETTPLEVLAGQGTATLALTAALVAVQVPLALHRTSISSVVPLIVCTMWLATFLAGWLALMLFLGTALEGKANAVAMIAVLFLPLALSAGPIDRLPRLAVTIIRGTLLLLPQVDQMTAMFRAILGRSTPPRAAPFVLLASPFFYFALASIRLHRIQPAGRLTQ